MNEKELNQKRKKAFAKFIKRNPDACSADYETWHQVWDELVKLFVTPDVSVAVCDKCGAKTVWHPSKLSYACWVYSDRQTER